MDRDIRAMWVLYLHRFLNEFADSLVKVFVPVVVYERSGGSLGWVLVYVLGYYVLQSILNWVLRDVLCKWPLRSMLVRLVPVAGLQMVLVSDLGIEWLVAGLVLGTTLSNVSYWMSVNYLFATLAGKNIGLQTGQMRAVSRLGNLLGPLLGGLLIAGCGMWAVVLPAMVVYVLSIVVVVPVVGRLRNEFVEAGGVVTGEEEQEAGRQPVVRGRLWRFWGAYVLVGIFDSSELFWSVYIFMISAGYVNVGIAAMLIKAGVMAANLITGAMSDKGRGVRVAVVCAALFGVSWLLRVYAEGAVSMYVLSVAAGFLSPFFVVPVFSKFILEAKQSGELASWLAGREVSLKVGGVIVCAVVAAVGVKGAFVLACFGAGRLAVVSKRLMEGKCRSVEV